MARFVPSEEFEPLTTEAEAVLERARAIVTANGFDDPLVGEAQAFALAVMALARQSGLTGEALMVALGGAVGTIMAQGMEAHAVLWQRCRNQVRATYDEVIEAVRPKGNA
jgi:hypothetical protein